MFVLSWSGLNIRHSTLRETRAMFVDFPFLKSFGSSKQEWERLKSLMSIRSIKRIVPKTVHGRLKL